MSHKLGDARGGHNRSIYCDLRICDENWLRRWFFMFRLRMSFYCLQREKTNDSAKVEIFFEWHILLSENQKIMDYDYRSAVCELCIFVMKCHQHSVAVREFKRALDGLLLLICLPITGSS